MEGWSFPFLGQREHKESRSNGAVVDAPTLMRILVISG